jgi:hypothetical protein
MKKYFSYIKLFILGIILSACVPPTPVPTQPYPYPEPTIPPYPYPGAVTNGSSISTIFLIGVLIVVVVLLVYSIIKNKQK